MKKHGRKVKGERIVEAVRIDMRPEEANSRTAPGHWETDNMEGKKGDKTGISVTVVRMSRVTRLAKLGDHLSETKANSVIQTLQKEPACFRETVTADNGPENSKHKTITDYTGVAMYFCYPYHSWEKPTVENTIGRLRRFVPKGVSVDCVTDKDLKIVENKLNNTPRKCLGFLTPNEVRERILTSASTINWCTSTANAGYCNKLNCRGYSNRLVSRGTTIFSCLDMSIHHS